MPKRASLADQKCRTFVKSEPELGRIYLMRPTGSHGSPGSAECNYPQHEDGHRGFRHRSCVELNGELGISWSQPAVCEGRSREELQILGRSQEISKEGIREVPIGSGKPESVFC